jgi:phosphate transport system substrate-binding protein
VESAQSGDYVPLARPLYVYAKTSALERQEVADFLRYMLDNETSIAEQARFVPLNDEQLAKAKADLEAATGS